MVVAEQFLQLLRVRGLASGRAAERGRRCFRGVPGPLRGFTCLVERRVLVFGGGYGRQDPLESPLRPPDRLGQYFARLAFRQRCQFAAWAGAARIYAVERTTVAVLAQALAAANGVAEVVQVIHGDVTDVELPGRVDVIVSEWLGGFGIDEGMLGPVIAARDRWLKPGGVMIPRSVTAWTALVQDRYTGDMVGFLRDNPYGLRLDDLAEATVNEIFYSGTFRHLAAGDRRSEPGRLWTTDADVISLEQAQGPHGAETPLPVRDHGTANALALWFSAELAPSVSLSVRPGDPPTHWGMTTAPLRRPVELRPGMVVRARVRTAPAPPAGTWTSWAVALPGAGWEEHDEQAIWEEIDD